MKLIATLFFSFLNANADFLPCKVKLQQARWPVDCFLKLSLDKKPLTSSSYKNMDLWCKLNKTRLLQQTPPKAIFSLKLSPLCKKIAAQAKSHHDKLKILDGSFSDRF